MKQLENKTVFITGASDGIGKAAAYKFAEAGADLIISSRRENVIKEIGKDIADKFGVKVKAFKLDVRNMEEVEKAVERIEEDIDILINNAGLSRGLEFFYNDNPAGWEEMIDTNIKGLLYVTRAVVKKMISRNSGHILNLGSIAGHEAYSKGGVYCATKHAVKAITESLRKDLLDKNIKVTTVDPGMVETSFSVVRFYGDKERADAVYKGFDPLRAEDIAETLLFCSTRPAHVNINEIIIMPAAQASATIVNKKL